NEAPIRGCLCVGVNAVSRNRAAEAAGCRKRALENVRSGAACRRLFAPRYTPCVDFLCWLFLCAGLYGICALAVSASAELTIPIKTRRFITLSVVDFVDQTPATDTSCTATKPWSKNESHGSSECIGDHRTPLQLTLLISANSWHEHSRVVCCRC